MSKIHINRDRQNLGQFTPEAVAAGLRDGRFLPTDLAWTDGMESWQPLATFTDLPAPGEIAPPSLAPGSEVIAPPSSGPAGPPTPEWERRDETGYFHAAIATIRQVFTNPIVTFRDLTRTGGFLGPLMFCYLLQILCGLVSVLETAIWLRVLPAGLLKHLGENPSQAFNANLVYSVPTMLVFGLVVPFIFAGIYHLLIRLITKSQPAYETVFRTYCYVMGSVSIVNLLPFPPIPAIQFTFMFFVFIVAFGYLTIALREAVGMTTLESLGVVLLPMILCCFCVAALMGAVIGLAGSVPALQGLGQ